MANRYWVNGTGNWSDNANHWASVSNGTPGASLPTSSDDVFIDYNSGLGGGTINMDTILDTSACKDFTSITGTSYTIKSVSDNLNIYGSCILESGITTSGTLYICLVATTTGHSIITAGVNVDGKWYIGDNQGGLGAPFVGGGWTLQDNLTTSGQFFQSNGTFDANGHNITANDFFFLADTGFTPTFIMRTGAFSPIRSAWTLNELNGVKVNIIAPAYTSILKPTTLGYTQVNSSGKEGFDDASVSFDSAGTFFDGINNAVYTNVNKPTGTGYSSVAKPT